jgi:hypothetical protein
MSEKVTVLFKDSPLGKDCCNALDVIPVIIEQRPELWPFQVKSASPGCLRRSWETILLRQNVPSDLADTAIGHQPNTGNTNRKAYAREVSRSR